MIGPLFSALSFTERQLHCTVRSRSRSDLTPDFRLKDSIRLHVYCIAVGVMAKAERRKSLSPLTFLSKPLFHLLNLLSITQFFFLTYFFWNKPQTLKFAVVWKILDVQGSSFMMQDPGILWIGCQPKGCTTHIPLKILKIKNMVSVAQSKT